MHAVLGGVRSPRILAVIAIAVLIGAGLGAGAYALFNTGTDTTVVRQVHVTQSLQTADKSGSALSIGSIYKLAHKGVVKISVTSGGSSSSPFEQGSQQAQGSGFVCALHRQMTSPNNFTIDNSIQTDAAINHGNSGGPLLNMAGRVIGITSQIESDSGGNDGVGFAVPSNTAHTIANRLISTGKVEHAYLGVELADIAGDGARVSQVVPGKPASKAGLQSGDVITSFGGKKITSVDELRAAVDARHPGDTVSV